MPALVKLVSSDEDKKEFCVEPKVARMSKTVQGLMEAMNMDETTTEEFFAANPIPLPNVGKDELERVLEWCEKHKDDAPMVEVPDDGKEKITSDIPEWDKNFLEMDFKSLTELMKAANYLDCRGLFINISKTIANMIKTCKTAQEVRDKFHIHNDLTKEEEEAIRKENSWCDE